MSRLDRFSANPQMQAHGVPKWGYGPVSGATTMTYWALDFIMNGVYASFWHVHGVADPWLRFSAPAVGWIAKIFPAVDAFEAHLLLVSRYAPSLSREADIPLLRNVVAFNCALFALFAIAIAIMAPIEARKAARIYGRKIIENAEGALQRPLDYGLTYAYGQLNRPQRWLANNTGVRIKELAIVAFSLVTLGSCYFGFDQIAAFAFILGTPSGIMVVALLYFGGQLFVWAIGFFLPVCLFSLRARKVSR